MTAPERLHTHLSDAVGRLPSTPSRRWLLLLIGFLLAFGGGLFLAAPDHYIGFHALNPWLHDLLPAGVWAWITRFGDERILLGLSLILAYRRPEIFWSLIIAAIIASLFSRGLKTSLEFPRPPAVLPLDQIKLIGPLLYHHSFPSGHTVSAFVIAGVLAAFARQGWIRLLLLGLATSVGLSRLALGIHWPLDVLAGAAGGLIAALLAVSLTHHWRGLARFGLRPGVYLFTLALPLFSLFGLLRGDSGNPHTPVLVYPLVFAVLLITLRDWWSLLRPDALLDDARRQINGQDND